MHELLITLHDYHVGPILLIAGALLIVIDYVFPTDIACQFGYASLAGAVFLMLDQSVEMSAIIAAVVWGALLVAHFTVLHRLLDNVPDESENVSPDVASD